MNEINEITRERLKRRTHCSETPENINRRAEKRREQKLRTEKRKRGYQKKKEKMKKNANGNDLTEQMTHKLNISCDRDNFWRFIDNMSMR